MRSLLVISAVCFCVLSLASCGGGGGGSNSNGDNLTPDDFGTTVTARVGQRLMIGLPTNPSTGYSWHRSWAPQELLALQLEYYGPDLPEVTGSGGTQWYQFIAAKTGTAVITMQYGRWPDGEIQDPHTITVRIAD